MPADPAAANEGGGGQAEEGIPCGQRAKRRSWIRRFSQSEQPMNGTDSLDDDESESDKEDGLSLTKKKGMKQAAFIDAEQMKEKVRQSLLKPDKQKVDYFKKLGPAQAIARSPIFEHVTLAVIAFNAIWIAHDTDSNPAEMLIEAAPKFQIAEYFFCAYFSSELYIRFASFAKKKNVVKDPWFVFDSSLVSMMVMETWVMSGLVLLIGINSGGLANASIVRIARLLRLTRMARMARLLRVVPELMILIKGMVAAIRSVFFTICLLVIIMYVFAISLTQLTKDTPLQEHYFKSVTVTMYSLMMHGCLLDGPKEISDALGRQSAFLPPIFWLFVLMAALTVMNMLVGVLCEVVSAVAATEKEENLVNFVKGRVMKVVESLDKDGDKQISKAEFSRILENQNACRALHDVGVDVVGLVDLADTIFEDQQGREMDELDFPAFMDVVLKLRGTNQATVKDIVQLQRAITGLSQRLGKLADGGRFDSPGSPSSPKKATPGKAKSLSVDVAKANADLSKEETRRRKTADRSCDKAEDMECASPTPKDCLNPKASKHEPKDEEFKLEPLHELRGSWEPCPPQPRADAPAPPSAATLPPLPREQASFSAQAKIGEDLCASTASLLPPLPQAPDNATLTDRRREGEVAPAGPRGAPRDVSGELQQVARLSSILAAQIQQLRQEWMSEQHPAAFRHLENTVEEVPAASERAKAEEREHTTPPPPPESAPQAMPVPPSPPESAPQAMPMPPSPPESAPQAVPTAPQLPESAPQAMPMPPPPPESAPQAMPTSPQLPESVPQAMPTSPPPPESAPQASGSDVQEMHTTSSKKRKSARPCPEALQGDLLS